MLLQALWCIPVLFLLLAMQGGIHYECLQEEGKIRIHLLEVDPEKAIIKAVRARCGLENTSSIAKREGAIAAINGGFFHMQGPLAGTPSGVLKISGQLLSLPRHSRAAIGWREGGKWALIDRLEARVDESSSHSILLKSLLEPDNLEEWNEMEHIVGGTPLLVARGELIADYSPEKTRESFLVNRHPRTAVGLKPDGHWLFMVVEGRLWYSVGMTIRELAEWMHALGCVYALNLDGGGSSTLYLKGAVVNTPSGDDEDTPGMVCGTERAVSDALLISPRNTL